MGIAEEDLTLLREAVAEVAKYNLGSIMCKKTDWTISITTQVNWLAETVT